MPHIKVKKFDTRRLDGLSSSDLSVEFRALAVDGLGEMVGIKFEDERFMFDIKPKDNLYLIKPDIISRPLDVNKIKKALASMVKILNLEVLQSNIALSPNKPALAVQANKKIRDFESPEFSRKKIAIEVGFGSGRHLLYQAQKKPETLFIGIEIHTPSAQQVLKQIEIQGLDNVWVINYDARLLLEMMPSNSCSHIYVHFPVPWDKKPHRRVISERFLTESMRALDIDGELELRTDSDNYYAYALEVFSSPKKMDFKVEKNRELEIISKYEDRWRAQKKDIYTLTAYSKEASESRICNYSFDFIDKSTVNNMSDLPGKAIINKDFFIHFERKYAIVGEENMMIRCAFGSFDKPEHKYLIQNINNVSYYPQDPVKTEVNYLAHKHIGELIYG